MDNDIDRPRTGENFLPNSDRTKRLMHLRDGWYFLTREDRLPLGPFSSRESAMQAISDYVDFSHHSSEKMLNKLHAHMAHKSLAAN